MKFLLKYRIKELEKQLNQANKLLAPNIEQAIDIMFLRAELQDKINRLKIKVTK